MRREVKSRIRAMDLEGLLSGGKIETRNTTVIMAECKRKRYE